MDKPIKQFRQIIIKVLWHAFKQHIDYPSELFIIAFKGINGAAAKGLSDKQKLKEALLKKYEDDLNSINITEDYSEFYDYLNDINDFSFIKKIDLDDIVKEYCKSDYAVFRFISTRDVNLKRVLVPQRVYDSDPFIINAIDDYNNKQIETLKSTHILSPSECATYDDYLKNLEKEIHIRCGRWEYQAKTWRAIFKTHYDNELGEALSVYKEELKRGITIVHTKLQSMDFLDEDFVCDAIDDRNIESLREYYYEMEKMSYLFPSYALEDRETEDFSFIDEPIALDCLRLKEMLDTIDKALQAGMIHEELKMCGRYLDGRYQVSKGRCPRNTIFARNILLSTIPTLMQ